MRPIALAGLLVGLAGCHVEPRGLGPTLSNTRAGTGWISRDDQAEAARILRERLTAAGRHELSMLAGEDDPMLALHALWELEKGRPGEKRQFRAAFRDRLGIEPPAWWCRLLAGVVEYETCHSLPGVDSSCLKDSSTLVCDTYRIEVHPDIAGFRYTIEAYDQRTGLALWMNDVWAVGRTALCGLGVHQIEMRVNDSCVFLFGAESHGAYAEVFRMTDGEPLFRFSTCYWFDFSETWRMR